MFTDERKYSRPHRPDVSPYAFDGNGVLFMNCKKKQFKTLQILFTQCRKVSFVLSYNVYTSILLHISNLGYSLNRRFDK